MIYPANLIFGLVMSAYGFGLVLGWALHKQFGQKRGGDRHDDA